MPLRLAAAGRAVSGVGRGVPETVPGQGAFQQVTVAVTAPAAGPAGPRALKFFIHIASFGFAGSYLPTNLMSKSVEITASIVKVSDLVIISEILRH